MPGHRCRSPWRRLKRAAWRSWDGWDAAGIREYQQLRISPQGLMSSSEGRREDILQLQGRQAMVTAAGAALTPLEVGVIERLERTSLGKAPFVRALAAGRVRQ